MLVVNCAEHELLEIRAVVLGVVIRDLDCRGPIDLLIVAMNTHACCVCREKIGVKLDFLHYMEGNFQKELC